MKMQMDEYQMFPLINFVAGPALSRMFQKQGSGEFNKPNRGHSGCKHVNTGNTALFISGKLHASFTQPVTMYCSIAFNTVFHNTGSVHTASFNVLHCTQHIMSYYARQHLFGLLMLSTMILLADVVCSMQYYDMVIHAL